MKKFLLFMLLASSTRAQLSPQANSTGSITASGPTCATTNACIAIHIENFNPQGRNIVPTVTIRLTGTWVGLMQFEYSIDNTRTWTGIRAVATDGNWRFTLHNLTDFRVRASTFSSGSALVYMETLPDVTSPEGFYPQSAPGNPNGVYGCTVTSGDLAKVLYWDSQNALWYYCDSTDHWTAFATGGGGTGSVTSVGLALPSSLFTISGSPVTTSGTLTGAFASIGAHLFLGNNTSGSQTAALLQVNDSDLALSDITTNNVSTSNHGFTPKLPNDATKFLNGTGVFSVPATGGTGTVTSFSAGTLSPVFTTSVATATTTPALSFALSTAGAHTFLGNNTGSTAAPAYVQPNFTDLVGSNSCAQLPSLTGDVTSTNCATTLGTKYKINTCEMVVGDPGAASASLADDNDTPDVCTNDSGATYTITGVHCFAPTGSPTVTPIITGGSSTSILSGALTCSSTAGGAAGTLNGTPTQTNGQSIDGNITTAGGTAKYLVIRVTRTL